MGAEFIEVTKAAGPELNPSPSGVSYQSAYQYLTANAMTYMRLYKSISWIKSCVDMIADASTSETFVIRMKDQQQELDDQQENPRVKALQVFLDGINPNYDAMELMNKNVRAMQINGTSYCRVLRKAGGKQIVGLEYLQFSLVKPNVDDAGNLTSWSVKSKRGSQFDTVPMNDIAVFKLPNPDDDIIGLSPLESLDLPVAVDLQAQRFNEAAFRNGPYASMIIQMEDADPETIERNREYINTNFTKPENAHKPMLLEGNVKVIGDANMRRSVDASFIELRKFNREEICAVYRVPVTKIVTDGANRSNTAEHDETFIRDTIEPLQRIYWAQFNRRILQQELGVTDMFIAAGKKQDVNLNNVNIAKGMVQAGASGNEARKVMNLTSMDGYDTPMFLNTIVPEASTDDKAKNTPVTPMSPQQLKQPQDPEKKDVKKATQDNSQSDTQQQEEEFMALWMALMKKMRTRSSSAVSLHDLHRKWLPTAEDVAQLSGELYDLYKEVWLQAYNSRANVVGTSQLKDLPKDVADELTKQAADTANGIMETYKKELTDKMQQSQTENSHLVGQEQFHAVESDLTQWLKNRSSYKADEISTTESGDAWNKGLFYHDEKYAPDTMYGVAPNTTEHEACQEIIDGAPYTLTQAKSTPLPLHPNCPHRYYAITN